MPIQELKPRGSFGQTLSSALGQGLGSGLSRVLDQKGLQYSGFSPQEASLMSRLGPKEQAPFIENLLAGLSSPQQAAPEQGFMPSLQAPVQGMEMPKIGQTPQAQSIQQGSSQPMQQAAQQQMPQAPQTPKLSPYQRGVQLKKQAAEQAQMRKAALAETKELRQDLEAKSKTAKQSLRDLDRLEELENTGKLDTAGYVEFLKRSGLDMPALMNPETEEFQKIAYGFMRNAKEVFGSRISNFEIDQFLKTIPSLSQSPEGRKRVISNLKYLNRANVEYNETKKDIIRENGGFPPIDLADQIDDRMENKLNKLSDKFKQDLAKPVPKGQHKLITALQATAGSTIGNLPKAAGGAITGAGIGGLVGGPVGAVIGGIGGGLAGLGGAHVNPKSILSGYGD